MKLKNNIWFIIIIVTFISLLILMFNFNCYKSNTNATGKTDTITITKVDTIYGDAIVITDTVPKLISKTIIKYDTIDKDGVIVDIPIEKSIYSDTLQDSTSYKAYITGYKATLDSLAINYKPKVIERHTTQIITKEVNKKSNPFYYGIGVTTGYDVINKRYGLMIGFGAGIKFN